MLSELERHHGVARRLERDRLSAAPAGVLIEPNGTGEHAHWLWGEEGGLSARAAHARYGIWAKVPLARHEVHKGPGEGVVHAVRADEAGGIVGGALRASSKHRVSTDKGRERAMRVPRRVPICEMKSWFSAAFM